MRSTGSTCGGTFIVGQQAARRGRDGGSIVNVSSSMVRVASPALGVYAASKWAIDTLTRILAKELRGRDITSNAVVAALPRRAVLVVPATSQASCRFWSGRRGGGSRSGGLRKWRAG
jgi:NAD(P)-dependent dehydrogenase (short-subunit alcohol dehydrogenase family)